MGALGFRKLRNLRNKRTIYFAMIGLVIFSILAYSFFINSPKARAISTVGSSSDASSTGNLGQRHEVISSGGTIVAFFDAGSTSPTGIVYSTSTDNGSTWNAAIQVDSSQSHDFSVTIDGSDNIYIAYSDGSATPSVYIRKMTYSSGSWSVGSANTVAASTTCVSSARDDYYGPSVAINSAGTAFVALVDKAYTGATCASSTLGTKSFYSSNLSSWTAYTAPSNTTGLSAGWIFTQPAVVVVGKSVWAVITTSSSTFTLYTDLLGSGTWAAVTGIATTASSGGVSLLYSGGAIQFFYGTYSGLVYQSYTISSGSLSATTTISSSTSDVAGAISTDTQNLWVAYQSYVGTSSYNVVYKRYNGTSWDGSSTAITTDNLNNTNINLPEYMPGTANVPILWNTGTSSPYTVKAATFSTTGTVTDTGNQTSSYSGSLTGSSGDVVVKCGVWYYNTVNIVSGMIIKVCASNGQIGGSLTIYANSVTVTGTIDGSARGYPGGVNILGGGGAGGNSVPGGVAKAGNPGSGGTSLAGGTGAGSYGALGGAAGNNSTGGACGGSNPSGGGCGGAGSTTTAGTSASSPGGYQGAGVNGDSSTDQSLALGSGGGAGGAGGSGAGGGSGGSASNTCAAGGTGGNGAPGGVGGAGGNGGAYVKIFSTGSIAVTGTINVVGQTGASGGSGASGSNGVGGGPNGNTC
jgi:hypothetical protein